MASSRTLRIDCDLDGGLEDGLAEVLGRFPTLGAAIEPAEHGNLRIAVYVDPRHEDVVESLCGDLGRLGAGGIVVTSEAPRDWLENYREHVRPFPVGRTWWIDPHPDAPTPAPDGRRRLVLEPRMAFGTGAHESTALILLELEDHPPRGLTVLDVGTGSGILALAADALGARWTAGFDIDAAAVIIARQIRRDQEFRAATAYFVGPLRAVGTATFDLILCNMISEHSLPLAPELFSCLAAGGEAVFSGLLTSELGAVVPVLEGAGFRAAAVRSLGEWSAVRVVRGR